MMVQNFMSFFYWKSSKFMGKLENTCIKYNTEWIILLCATGTLGMSKQVHHWVSMECYQRGTLLSILKLLRKKAGGFPSHAQGKEIDSGIVA